MRLDRLATLAVVRPLRDLGLRRRKPAVPVLMYHSVSTDLGARSGPYYRVVTSPARFRRQMYLLHEHRYRAMGLSEALASAGERDEVSRRVVITFDDGFRDFLTESWPILAELGFGAIVFLPTAFIGASRRCFKGRECLTWSEVRQLHGQGVSFGSHTLSHPVLHSLPWAEVRRELQESREQIEEALGAPVTTFAHPYAFPREDGPYCGRLAQELQEQGYEAGVTTMIGRLSAATDRYRMERLPVNDGDDDALFTAKLTGAYDWLGTLQGGWRRLKQEVGAESSRPGVAGQ